MRILYKFKYLYKLSVCKMYTVIIPIAIQQFSLYKFYSHRAAKPYHSILPRLEI